VGLCILGLFELAYLNSLLSKRKCGAARPPQKLMQAGCGRVVGAISVTRTLIYLILKYYTVEKKTKIP